MKKVQVLSADEAVTLIPSGATIAYSGFGGTIGHPEQLSAALERRFLATGRPEGLTALFPCMQSSGPGTAVDHLGHPGLLRRVVGGHFAQTPHVLEMVVRNQCEGYNFPQGVHAQLYREAAARRPGLLTSIGLGTFVDPRQGGAKLNSITTEDLIQVINLGGEEYLFYKAPPITVALVRGTYADEWGNISTEKETAHTEALAAAQAAHNAGGVVLAQVEKVVPGGSLHPKKVRIPGILVDAVVVDPDQSQIKGTRFDPAMSGDQRVPLSELERLPSNERRIIATRAAQELQKGMVVNLGVGMPLGIASICAEQGRLDDFVLTVEAGLIGGLPLAGPAFGAALNPEAIIDHPAQFDFYQGGGLDLTCLGMAQVDARGNINVSRIGPLLMGVGGFIDISQSSRKVVFCGSFTAGGLKVAVEDGRLQILQEGREQKFVEQVEMITFSGDYARRKGQQVLYVTERCVFELHPAGLTLTEIAPDIDLERDILAHMQFRPKIAPELKTWTWHRPGVNPL